MERSKVVIDELKMWKVKLETAHKEWKDELETLQHKFISDCQLQYLSYRELKDE